jgi:hypothetical protein
MKIFKWASTGGLGTGEVQVEENESSPEAGWTVAMDSR